MFYRSKFVTNSSSTSFIGFGIMLDQSDYGVMCRALAKLHPEEFKKALRWYEEKIGDQDVIEYLIENGLEYEIISEVCYEIDLEFTGPDMASFGYLSMGYPHARLHEDGSVSVDPDCLKESFRTLNALLDETDLTKQIEVHQDAWYS